jgi:hypothetical protein
MSLVRKVDIKRAIMSAFNAHTALGHSCADKATKDIMAMIQLERAEQLREVTKFFAKLRDRAVYDGE